MYQNQTALVVLSGGQDSVTCLAWAAENFSEVHAITFDYGQRHRVEIECAAAAARELDCKSHKVLNVTALSEVAVSALTNTEDDVNAPHKLHGQLPASYVPNRNATFLTLAHAYGQTIGAGALVTGVCQTDYSGYPDCRDEFRGLLEMALNSGAETDIKILAPLMYLDKAATWSLAHDLGALDIVLEHSHTCYEGDHTTRNDWGYGCGVCPACQLRAKGWVEFAKGVDDVA